MRITHQMLNQTAIEGMQANMRRLAEVQNQAVTTKRINRPDDDPFGVEQALGFRAHLQTGEAILHNVAMSSDWLNSTDTALTDLNTLLTRMQNLALQGASETLGPDERQALATEVEGLIEETIALGNSRHGDQYIFSGFQVNTPPFSANRDAATGLITSITYSGDNGLILREVEPGSNMSINLAGDDVFTDVFNNLIGLRDTLKSNTFVTDDVTTKVSNIQAQINSTSDLQAAVGTKNRRLEMTASRVEAAQVGLQELLSNVEDADMAEVISQLNQHKFAYESALAVNAQTLKLSLLDFLR